LNERSGKKANRESGRKSEEKYINYKKGGNKAQMRIVVIQRDGWWQTQSATLAQ